MDDYEQRVALAGRAGPLDARPARWRSSAGVRAAQGRAPPARLRGRAARHRGHDRVRAARRRAGARAATGYFVVDEYQDVSPLQQQLLDLWLGDRSDLCVVGDASQTIYSFAGATRRVPARLRAPLRGRDDRAARAQLPVDARDPRRREPPDARPRRRAAARAVGARRDAAARCRGAATPRRRARRPPTVGTRREQLVEPSCRLRRRARRGAGGVATRIRDRVDAGVPPETIAVLYRVNSQAAILERALAEVGVSSRVRGATAVLRPARGARGACTRCAAPRCTIARRAALQVGERRAARARVDRRSRPRAAARCATRWESLNALVRARRRGARPAPRSARSPTTCASARRRSTSRRSPRSCSRPCTARRASSGTSVHIVGLTEGTAADRLREGIRRDRRGAPTALRRHHAGTAPARR